MLVYWARFGKGPLIPTTRKTWGTFVVPPPPSPTSGVRWASLDAGQRLPVAEVRARAAALKNNANCCVLRRGAGGLAPARVVAGSGLARVLGNVLSVSWRGDFRLDRHGAHRVLGGA